jgi:hypothetical protein
MSTDCGKIKELAKRLAVAYHMQCHSTLTSPAFFQCPEPFCVEARELGLFDDEDTSGESEE